MVIRNNLKYLFKCWIIFKDKVIKINVVMFLELFGLILVIIKKWGKVKILYFKFS